MSPSRRQAILSGALLAVGSVAARTQTAPATRTVYKIVAVARTATASSRPHVLDGGYFALDVAVDEVAALTRAFLARSPP